MKITGFYFNEKLEGAKNKTKSIKTNAISFMLLAPVLSTITTPTNPMNPNEVIKEIQNTTSMWDSFKTSLEIIATFCKGVIAFFKFIYTVITNISVVSFWTCLCLALVGYLMYAIMDVRKGKTIAVFSFVFYILVKVLSLAFN